MRIGEIKKEALLLMYPNAPIRFDTSSDEELEKGVFELKCNPSYEGLLESAVGSINRALAIIEGRGLSLTKCHDIASSICDRRGDGRIILKTMDDFLSVEMLLFHANGKTVACPYQLIGDELITDYRHGVFTVVYKSKLPRITSVTAEAYKLMLPSGVAELIPYFVKADLFTQESEEEARASRELFDRGLEEISSRAKAQCHQCFQIVYSME